MGINEDHPNQEEMLSKVQTNPSPSDNENFTVEPDT
jgi:hypothetical protein